jgi:hypothetical protein
MKITTTAIAALAAMFVAGCSAPAGLTAGPTAVHNASVSPAPSTSTAAQPAAARGVEGTIESIPWSQVGPGWTLATWSPASGTRPGEQQPPNEPTWDTATTTLYLVDPAGGRYPITTFPPSGNAVRPKLVDWSGDGGKALFSTEYGNPDTAIVVDLHTGKQTTFAVDGPARFTRPDGKALLLSGGGGVDRTGTLERVDLAGKPQLTYPTDKLENRFNGEYLSTPDGMRLVLGTNAGLALMGNDGTPGATLPVPAQGYCQPLRWWDAPGTTVLASCGSKDDAYTSSLWRVPIDGSAPTALTAPNNGSNDGKDHGDVNAWQLPAGTFVQALGACGVIFVAKLNDDGTTTPVSVPGLSDAKSIRVIGADGNALYLHAHAACGGGQSLLRYDPQASTSTVLLGPPINGGGVIDAVPYKSEW